MTVACCAHAQVAERFKCLSFTLEMPFKDTQDCEDSVHGWNPACPARRAHHQQGL